MAGLLDILPTIYSTGNTLRRNVRGLLEDPRAFIRSIGQDFQSQNDQIQSDVKGLLGNATPEERAAIYDRMTQQAGGLLGIVKPKTLARGQVGESGYAYHATNSERLGEIADAKKLKTFKPNYGTEQSAWPDGSVEKRIYFGANPENLYQFAPAEGRPVLVRTKRDGRIFTENTGDLFAKKPIDAKHLEYLGEDDAWHSVSGLLGQ